MEIISFIEGVVFGIVLIIAGGVLMGWYIQRNLSKAMQKTIKEQANKMMGLEND